MNSMRTFRFDMLWVISPSQLSVDDDTEVSRRILWVNGRLLDFDHYKMLVSPSRMWAEMNHFGLRWL